jgi:histidinol-phosphatase (PHP family)
VNDYHLHSYLCNHGQGQIYEYVETALERGLTEIGFSEHNPIPALIDTYGRMSIDKFPVYLNDVAEAQCNYPGIKIRLGLEADYLPAHLEYISAFLQHYPFDFVIGSVHFIGDWDLSNPKFSEHIHEFGVNQTYRAYYKLVKETAMTGLYDVLGHFDMPKRLGYFPDEDLSAEINEALQAVKLKGMALDVNTSGMRWAGKEIYPSESILRSAFSLGIPIVIGSDAHKPEDVANYFSETCELVKRIGYRETCIFSRRQRKMVSLVC